MKYWVYTWSLLLLLCFSACGGPGKVPEGSCWKYAEGYHIGDILCFQEQKGWEQRNGSQIFRDSVYVAELHSVSAEKLLVSAPSDGRLGYYVYLGNR